MTRWTPYGPPRWEHQRRGLRKLIETRGQCALLFSPGLGKSATVLDYASLLAVTSRRETRVLVLAPLAALDTWVLQAQQYVAPDIDLWAEVLGGSIRQRAESLARRGGQPILRAEGPRRDGQPRARGWRLSPSMAVRQGNTSADPRTAVLTAPAARDTPSLILCALSLSSFSSRSAVGSRRMSDVLVQAVERYAPDLIVVDESHLLKSPSSNMSRAVARLTPLCQRRVILTGTVQPHSPLDVWAQWRFLSPQTFGTRFAAFRDRYAVMGGFQNRQPVRFHHLDHMREAMGRNAVVATKEESLDLPPTTDVVVPVHLSPAEQRAYTGMKQVLAATVDDRTVTVPNRLAQMMRLRQITSGFLPDDTGTVARIGDSKAQAVRSLIHDTLAGEKRAVVFAHFRAEIEQLTELLRAPGTTIRTITGDTPAQQRRAIREEFGLAGPLDERIVLIAQVRTMSLAVNELVTASHAVYTSLPLTRDDLEQSRARLDRSGQVRPVTFWTLEVPQSVDSVIRRAHHDRTQMEDALLAHLRSNDTDRL